MTYDLIYKKWAGLNMCLALPTYHIFDQRFTLLQKKRSLHFILIIYILSIYPLYKYEILIFKFFTHNKKMKYTFLILPMKLHNSYFYILIHFLVLKTNASMSFK